MKGVLLKDLYIARSNILVTVVSLVVLGFGLSFLLETSALLVLAPVASTSLSDFSALILPSIPCAYMGRLV